MFSIEDRASAFRCSVSPENSHAKVRIGRRNWDVRVCELSRECFTLIIPKAMVRYAPQGAKIQVFYRDEIWLVQAASHELTADEHQLLQVNRLQDLTKMEYRSNPWWWLGSGNVEVRSKDPMLPVGVIAGVLLVLMIMPGFGDDLGTTSFVTDAIANAVETIGDVFGGD